MPNFKILRFRPLIFIGKYLLIPTIGFAIGKYDFFFIEEILNELIKRRLILNSPKV